MMVLTILFDLVLLWISGSFETNSSDVEQVIWFRWHKPLPPKLNGLLLELPESHLRQWGSWFLAISIPASSQNCQWDQVLGHINKDGFYFSLAGFLNDKFDNTMIMVDLNEVILIAHESLSLRPIPHPYRPSSLTDLGLWLLNRFRMTRSMADLKKAILMHRESLSLRPTPHPHRSTSLNSLALGLVDRFVVTGSMTDLEEAISIHRETLSLCPTPHPGRSFSLNSLAGALLCRLDGPDRFHDWPSRSYFAASWTICLRFPSHLFYNLANALQNHFRKTGSMTDLEELFCCIVNRYPSASPLIRLSSNNLAGALWDRFGKTDSMANLEEAISSSMLRESVSLGCAAKIANWPWTTLHVSWKLEVTLAAIFFKPTRFEENGSQSDLKEATSLRRNEFYTSITSIWFWWCRRA